MIEGGVAGQIDVKTQRPFDFDGSKSVLSARGIHSEEGNTTDPTFSALLRDAMGGFDKYGERERPADNILDNKGNSSTWTADGD